MQHHGVQKDGVQKDWCNSETNI